MGPIFVLRPLLVIDGSATLFGLFRLSYLCLHGNKISFWFRWCPKTLIHILVGFIFGLISLILSFHWMPLRFGCLFVRPPVSVWRRRLSLLVSWLVLWSTSWFLSLAMWCWIFFQSNLLLMIFPIFLPLSMAWRWMSVIFLFSASVGFVSLGFGSISVREINVFVWKNLLGEWRLCFWPNGSVLKFLLCQFLCLRGCLGGFPIFILSADYEDNLSRLFLSTDYEDSHQPLILSEDCENSRQPLCERGLWKYPPTSIVSADYEDSRRPLFWAQAYENSRRPLILSTGLRR